MFKTLISWLKNPFGDSSKPRRIKKVFPSGTLDVDALKIVRRLRRVGHFEAYLVGGGVRDPLLDRAPKDFDISTSASPAQVRKLFRNSRLIGRRFLLNHVYFRGGKIIEVATFRMRPEVLPEDQNQPLRADNVFGNAEQDARRRDFTINGLFYDDDKQEILDYVGGLKDLKKRRIRSIGEAGVRFREDPIRMLRAVKFSAKLDFDIEKKTLRAIHGNSMEIVKCAAPRIVAEITQILAGGGAAKAMGLLIQSGLLKAIFPELASVSEEVLVKRFGALDKMTGSGDAPSAAMIWASLFWDQAEKSFQENRGKGQKLILGTVLKSAVERLKLPRKDMDMARLLILSQSRLGSPNRRHRGSMEAFLGRPYLREALVLFYIRMTRSEPSHSTISAYKFWRSRWLQSNRAGRLPLWPPTDFAAKTERKPIQKQPVSRESDDQKSRQRSSRTSGRRRPAKPKEIRSVQSETPSQGMRRPRPANPRRGRSEGPTRSRESKGELPVMAKEGMKDRQELAVHLAQTEIKEDQDRSTETFFNGDV